MFPLRSYFALLLCIAIIPGCNCGDSSTGPTTPGNSSTSSALVITPDTTHSTVGANCTFTAAEVGLRKYQTITVSWGDGTPDHAEIMTRDTQAFSFAHTFSAVGRFNVTGKVVDEASNMVATATAIVIIDSAGAHQSSNIQMVPLAGGSFTMGTSVFGLYDSPPHQVTVTGFLIGKFEVTQGQWLKVMGSYPGYRQRDDRMPAFGMPWASIWDFCNKLSILEGLTPCYAGNGTNIVCNWTANGYRLPTEAEWEYAARAGTQWPFYTGPKMDTIPNDRFSNIDEPNLDIAGWYAKNSGDTLHLPGLKQPNAFGLYDMLGNVAEWVWDWQDQNYYQHSPVQDPTGPATGVYKVQRGGWASAYADYCSVSARPAYDVNTQYWGEAQNGFRVVRRP